MVAIRVSEKSNMGCGLSVLKPILGVQLRPCSSDRSLRLSANKGIKLKADHLDLTGEVCPLTFVRVRLWLETAAIGAELTVDIDYYPATQSIPRSLNILGQELVSLRCIGDQRWQLHIRKRVHDPTEAAYAETEQFDG